MKIKLFYSYSHKDFRHRESMETHLASLKRHGLSTWSDCSIQPGQNISEKIRREMKAADIFVFLISANFLDSEPCRQEWDFAQNLPDKPVMVPVIVDDCLWQDLVGETKALPNDGKPVTRFSPQSGAWCQVAEGIKSVVDELISTFDVKFAFLKEMEKTYFISEEHISLRDIFVFPELTFYGKTGDMKKIANEHDALQHKNLLIHGDENSGKTALLRYLFLTYVAEGKISLLLDDISTKANHEKILMDAFSASLTGAYQKWFAKPEKILLVDDFTKAPRSLAFMEYASKHFDHVILTTSTESYFAYFKDEARLANFSPVKIGPLSSSKQEKLIRKRISLMHHAGDDTPVLKGEGNQGMIIADDTLVDRAEKQVNDVIINSRVVPRYPFYILSILQTLESFMPRDLSISSYGHCYYALIVAHLRKAGVSEYDGDINSALQFLRHLAYALYRDGASDAFSFDKDKFLTEYKNNYHIKDAVLSRVTSCDFGLLKEDLKFNTSYAYYYFLGEYFAKPQEGDEVEVKNIISQLCEKSYLSSNHLLLLFTIHHHSDEQIVDDILLRLMCSLDSKPAVDLTREQTEVFSGLINNLKIHAPVSSEAEISQKRDEARAIQDQEDSVNNEIREESDDENINDLYRILQNSRLLSQILGTRYGLMKKEKVKTIVEAIIDSHLRAISLFLLSENELNELVTYIRKQDENASSQEVTSALVFFSFIWTIGHVGMAASSIQYQPIRSTVKELVEAKDTPVYDLIDYFNHIDTQRFSTESKDKLLGLLKKHDYSFMKKVLLLGTKSYFDTHGGIKPPVRQWLNDLILKENKNMKPIISSNSSTAIRRKS